MRVNIGWRVGGCSEGLTLEPSEPLGGGNSFLFREVEIYDGSVALEGTFKVIPGSTANRVHRQISDCTSPRSFPPGIPTF